MGRDGKARPGSLGHGIGSVLRALDRTLPVLPGDCLLRTGEMGARERCPRIRQAVRRRLHHPPRAERLEAESRHRHGTVTRPFDRNNVHHSFARSSQTKVQQNMGDSRRHLVA